jgi:hypothetical protein
VSDTPSTYFLLLVPGMQPTRKGPMPDELVGKFIEDLYAANPSATVIVMEGLPSYCWPQDGREKQFELAQDFDPDDADDTDSMCDHGVGFDEDCADCDDDTGSTP